MHAERGRHGSTPQPACRRSRSWRRHSRPYFPDVRAGRPASADHGAGKVDATDRGECQVPTVAILPMKLDPQFLAVHELGQVSLASFGIAFHTMAIPSAGRQFRRIDAEQSMTISAAAQGVAVNCKACEEKNRERCHRLRIAILPPLSNQRIGAQSDSFRPTRRLFCRRGLSEAATRSPPLCA